jgi:hypothetical protein
MWQYPQTEMLCKKEAEKNLKHKRFLYRDTADVEPEIYDCTSNKWSHWNDNEKLKEKIWKLYQENIRWIHNKRQLYLEHHT